MAHTSPAPRVRTGPTVLVADDHRLIRIALRSELEEAGFIVRAEARTADEAIAGAVREGVDLCLLDVVMPGGGLFAAAEIRRRLPSAKVVMLTASVSEEHFLGAIRAGACGYLLKDEDPARLPAALRDVLAGIPAFPRRLTGPLVTAAREALGPPAAAEA